MIVMKMKMIVLPEYQAAFIRALQKIMNSTLVERGCIGCHLYQNIRNETDFALVEEWESRADLNDHFRRDTFKRLFPLMDFLGEPLESRIEYISDRAEVKSGAGMHEIITEKDDGPRRRLNLDTPGLPHPSRLFLDRVFKTGIARNG